MSSDRRFEQELPSLLDDLYVGAMPAYRDHVIQRIARTRQRPAWTFVERWIPGADVARQSVLTPRLPWRRIGLGLVLLALLVAMVAALLVGGRPRLPEPFGPARNGLVAYETSGDIYVVDPDTGDATAIVTGPDWDINPRWSRDGTSLAFERKVEARAGTSLLFVARRDGSDLIRVTPEPLAEIETYAFSPDGKQILITANRITGFTHLFVAAADGGGIRQIDLPKGPINATWRPDGSEILFIESGDVGPINAVNMRTGNVRTILKPTPGRFRGQLMWSPDGSLISYGEWVDEGPITITVQTHIIQADGTGDRVLPVPSGAVWQSSRAWSNDGTRLLALRGYAGDFKGSRPVAIPVDGSGFAREIDYPGDIEACCSDWEWAPDDSLILGSPADDSGTLVNQVLLDPVAGTARTVPWGTGIQPSWQRLAP